MHGRIHASEILTPEALWASTRQKYREPERDSVTSPAEKASGTSDETKHTASKAVS